MWYLLNKSKYNIAYYILLINSLYTRFIIFIENTYIDLLLCSLYKCIHY